MTDDRTDRFNLTGEPSMQSSTQTDWRETQHRKPANGPDYSLSRVFYRIVDTIEGMTVRRAG